MVVQGVSVAQHYARKSTSHHLKDTFILNGILQHLLISCLQFSVVWFSLSPKSLSVLSDHGIANAFMRHGHQQPFAFSFAHQVLEVLRKAQLQSVEQCMEDASSGRYSQPAATTDAAAAQLVRSDVPQLLHNSLARIYLVHGEQRAYAIAVNFPAVLASYGKLVPYFLLCKDSHYLPAAPTDEVLNAHCLIKCALGSSAKSSPDSIKLADNMDISLPPHLHQWLVTDGLSFHSGLIQTNGRDGSVVLSLCAGTSLRKVQYRQSPTKQAFP
jgi:hypothetical protein